MTSKAKNVNWGGLHLVVDSITTGKASAAAGENVTAPVKGSASSAATVALNEETVLGSLHVVELACTAFVVGTDAVDDATAHADGSLIYTLPAGDILVEEATIIGALTGDVTVTTDTPEFGLGNVLAAGANATLGASDSGAENIAGPFVATNVAGDTPTDGGTTQPGLWIPSASAHTVYFNVADTWADVAADGDILFTGFVIVKYRVL